MPTTTNPPKQKGFSFQGYDAASYKQTESYVQAIDALYNQAIQDFAKLASNISINNDKPFSFADYPAARGKAQSIIDGLASKMQAVITKGSREQWLYACKKNDAFLNHILNTSMVPKKLLAKLQDQNLSALDAFQNRKVKGLDLSQRVWNYAGQMKIQMELGIDIALGDGRSAQALSKDLRQYLVDPDKLFRRVRDKHGNLVLSKNAKAFNPGQGKYRSSYKNAMRLTRSEINMAYRESDQKRWQQLDFIVGFEVKLSNNHTLNGRPFEDICDRLVGKYPKEFIFKGWHPQCRCHAVPILQSPDEFNTDQLNSLRAAFKGTEYKKFASKNTVTDVPQGFKDWVAENTEASKNWTSPPYFVKDNFKNGNIADGLKFISKPIEQDVYFNDIPVAPIFEKVLTTYDKETLYRGDIKDKGETFSEGIDTKDYVSDGEAKNKAGFDWFTTSEEYAKKYATEQLSDERGVIKQSILTSIETKKLKILDFTKMDLTDQVNFHRSLYDSGVKNIQYKQDLLPKLNPGETITVEKLEKILKFRTGGNILNAGQFYSDGDMGIIFKKWLKENGFDGYRFQTYKYGDEIGLISNKSFRVKNREYIKK